MKKVLITGGSGFLGGHLVNHLSSDYQIAATYYQHPYQVLNATWIQIDLTKKSSELLDTFKPSVIIHCAGITKPNECEKQKKSAYTANVTATEHLVKAAEERKIRFIHLSTDMVFSGDRGNYTENNKTQPINYYGVTKVESEKVVKKFCTNYVIARSALIYGNPVFGGETFTQYILRRLSANQELMMFEDQFRTPILVNNLAEAIAELVNHDFIGTIHLAGSEKLSRYDFGIKIAERFHFPKEKIVRCSMYDVEPVAPRPKDVSLKINFAKSVLKTRLLNCDEGVDILFHELKKVPG